MIKSKRFFLEESLWWRWKNASLSTKLEKFNENWRKWKI